MWADWRVLASSKAAELAAMEGIAISETLEVVGGFWWCWADLKSGLQLVGAGSPCESRYGEDSCLVK